MTERATSSNPVLQLRLVVEVDDLDEAEAFYRDVLGLTEELAIDGDAGERVVILQAGRATLELANKAQHRMIDDLEVGRPVAPHMRVAFEVADARTATDAAVAAGASLVAAPVETPWRSLNARVDAPAGLHLTFFQELDSAQ